MSLTNNLLFWTTLGFGITTLIGWFLWKDEVKSIKADIENQLIKARADSVKRSKSIIRATISEDIIPLFPDFPYDLSDLKLFGKPIDYIVFDGMSEFRDGNKDKEITIVMADLKTGNAVKTPVQKAIMKAIQDGKIRFEEWRIDENNKLTVK